MSKTVQALSIAALALAISAIAVAQTEDDKKEEAKKPKHTIKEVMKKGLKGGKSSLNAKVLSGKASDKEKLELLDLYVSLVEAKPPKGEPASWQKFAGTAALAAAKVAVGREGAMKELKAATNCGKCHKAHKPPSK